jgi:hypothetical protein
MGLGLAGGTSSIKPLSSNGSGVRKPTSTISTAMPRRPRMFYFKRKKLTFAFNPSIYPSTHSF